MDEGQILDIDETSESFSIENALASKGQRFANYLVDAIVIYILNTGLEYLIGFQMNSFSFDSTFDYSIIFTSVLISISVTFFYYFICESAWGRSVGKFVTNTMVVDEFGDRPTSGQIAGRSISRYIPFEPFSVLFRDNGTGWHDTLAKTRVIDLSKLNR